MENLLAYMFMNMSVRVRMCESYVSICLLADECRDFNLRCIYSERIR